MQVICSYVHLFLLCVYYIIGLLTTPQLHYIVRSINTNNIFGIPTEEGYYEKLAVSFKDLLPKVVLSNGSE